MANLGGVGAHVADAWGMAHGMSPGPCVKGGASPDPVPVCGSAVSENTLFRERAPAVIEGRGRVHCPLAEQQPGPVHITESLCPSPPPPQRWALSRHRAPRRGRPRLDVREHARPRGPERRVRCPVRVAAHAAALSTRSQSVSAVRGPGRLRRSTPPPIYPPPPPAWAWRAPS